MPGRDVLPIPDRPYTGPVYADAKDPNATFPPIEPLRPPAGAPNVVDSVNGHTVISEQPARG